MAENTTSLLDHLVTIESHLRRLEEKIDRRDMREAPVQPWQYLVHRAHPWRQQLYVKGRNLTARQLVGSMKANQLDEAAAAADYRLPVEAIREALAYVERSKELLEIEAEIERLMLKRGGVSRAAGIPFTGAHDRPDVFADVPVLLDRYGRWSL
jgi:uncharacterized protein (DUF433 family)